MDLLKKVSSLLGIPGKISDKIVDKVFDVLSATGTRLYSVEEDVGKLRRIEQRIRALLTDAEQRRFVVDVSVKLWLRELRAVAFDVDTLLDRLDTAAAVSRATASASSSRKRKRLYLGAAFQLGLRQRWEVAARITTIKEHLDEISEQRKNFRFRDGDSERTAVAAQPEHHRRLLEVASLCDQRPIGRVEEKVQILAALVSDSTSPNLPVISILGMPGIGKTTVARSVYGHEQVQNFFPVRIWVWLPDVCDSSNAMKMIIEAATGTRCHLASLDLLQQRLRDHLSQRRFLLVMDNLWEESYQFWDSLMPPLMAGTKGSKVLITTRNQTVSRMMPNIILHINLKCLDAEECWQILQVCALSGCSDAAQQRRRLEPIGRRIAETCHGSPLIAKSIGVILAGANEQEEEWESILKEMQIPEDDSSSSIILEDGRRNSSIILISLQLSYHHLPYHLKQCFAFCSVLPAGIEFDKDELVRLWIAEGLAKNNGRRRAETVARSYFDELLWRSFFQASSSHHGQKKYRVPSLMLNLARHVSRHEALIANTHESMQLSDRPEWIRYATILLPEDDPLALERIERCQSLRFLKLCSRTTLHPNRISFGLLSELTCLRTLDLSYNELGFLPATVGCLVHLRYLGLRGTSVEILPEELCNLFNLQTLDLTDCYKLTDLPAGLSRLINMRHLCLHLDWDRAGAFRSMPRGVDKLESLQTLSRFVVVPEDGAGGCNIGELENLKVRGELCVLKLEGATVDGAGKARLGAKEHIHELMLQWSDGDGDGADERRIEESERVIEALCPPRNLRRLRIENYPGRKLPSWLETLSPLVSREIISCPRIA